MRSIQFDSIGTPTDVLTLREEPVPAPALGEVRVRVAASVINPSDIAFIQGRYGYQPRFPQAAGTEATGVIDALGEGVTGWQTGQAVSFYGFGAWADYACVAVTQLMPAPPALPAELACQMFVNPLTAWALLHDSGLKAGEWLLLTAGASTLGQMLLKLAHKRGIKVLATVRQAAQAEHLRTLGVDAVVDLSVESLPKRAAELAGKAGIPWAIDSVGGETGALALTSLGQYGTLITLGALSGEAIPMNPGLLIFKHLTIRGFWLVTWLQTVAPEVRAQLYSELPGLFADGTLQGTVEAVYPLEDFAKAMTHATTPGRLGKVVLRG